MSTARYELEWVMPQEFGLTTHVTLFDDSADGPHYVRGVGHGGDEADALLDLWTTLIDRNEPAGAIRLRCRGIRQEMRSSA